MVFSGTRNDPKALADAPECNRNTGQSTYRQCARNPWNDFAGNSQIGRIFNFFIAPSENKGVASLESYYLAHFSGVVGYQPINFILFAAQFSTPLSHGDF